MAGVQEENGSVHVLAMMTEIGFALLQLMSRMADKARVRKSYGDEDKNFSNKTEVQIVKREYVCDK